MSEQLVHLKIKIKSLVDESRNIRKEANKTSGMAKWRLNDHRTGIVRYHTRANLLAYGLLIGIPYNVMEKKCAEAPNFTTITKHAKKFGGTADEIDYWITEAKEYLKLQKEEFKLAS